MSYGANLMIAWMMFVEWFKETFGSGCAFYSEPLAPAAEYKWQK